MTTISVVIPTYNRAALVSDAIRSALKQTSVPDEIVVVDDGGKDNTAEVVGAFPAPVRYVRRENGGLSRARNTGIEAATGSWVAFLDDDDAYEPEKIASTREVIARFPHAQVIATDATLVSPSGRTQGMFEVRGRSAAPGGEETSDPFGWALASCFFAQSMVVRRDVLAEVGGFTPDLFYEDFDIGTRLALQHRWVIDGRRLVRVIRREDGGANLSAEWSQKPLRSYGALIVIYERLVSRLGVGHPHYAVCQRRLKDYTFELGCAHLLNGDSRSAGAAFERSLALDRSLRNRARIGAARLLGNPWLKRRRKRQLARMAQARG
ncbi:MAG: glycosyltransferase family A protein [Planctomycetota bacterium]|nr:glycosyltransferase family A protein [Planctomycetota bacterium]